MGRRRRGLRAALKAARLSDFYAHRVGAALFKGSRLIDTGCNKHKTHPQSLCFTQHAELNTVAGQHKYDLKGMTLYVARLTRTDRVSYAKPCGECQKVIKSVGICKVFYTGYNGELREMPYTEIG